MVVPDVPIRSRHDPGPATRIIARWRAAAPQTTDLRTDGRACHLTYVAADERLRSCLVKGLHQVLWWLVTRTQMETRSQLN